MKIGPAATPLPPLILPSEIILVILRYIARDEERQRTLHSCCLIARQWYFASVSLLYERPFLDGSNFHLFARTVCPSVAVPRRSNISLGTLVHKLNLRRLIHHSTNSLTARMLGRVKENLEAFTAPVASFSSNSLPNLGKCTKLRHVDLSLVCEPLDFYAVKKALSNMKQLKSARISRVVYGSGRPPPSQPTSWPSTLESLQIGGDVLNIYGGQPFFWPENLISLTLKECDDLSFSSVLIFTKDPVFCAQLRHLTISHLNRGLDGEAVVAFSRVFFHLIFLSVPADYVEQLIFMPYGVIEATAIEAPLEVLELSYTSSLCQFHTATMVEILQRCKLPHLRLIGFHESLCNERRIVEDEDLEAALAENVKEKGENTEDEDVGVYYFS